MDRIFNNRLEPPATTDDLVLARPAAAKNRSGTGHAPFIVEALHRVQQQIRLLVVRQARGDVSDARIEDFRVEDVHAGGGKGEGTVQQRADREGTHNKTLKRQP